jgi:ABC-2 type transport system ATP-binding protein
VGYVPDQLGVYPGLTVWQYLSFFARMAGVSAVERKSSVETLLTVVDLFDRRQLEVERLSRGMRRRLALARALVHNPSVLLLDDPLAGLDGRGRLELTEVLKELRGMGLTVVLSGHLLGDIVELCSHVAILREGRLIRHCAVEQLEGTPAGAPSQIEISVLLGQEIAQAVLSNMPEVRDLRLSGQTVSFGFEGDAAALATVLDQLVEEGVQISRFGPGPRRFDELAAGLVELENRPAT